ncbi:MAG: hypothetical protein ISR64_07500 [Deltaproteobacteria bacterium]|nr:hypothetical protein [Deltaproteobacteria bacterium]
MNRRNIVLAWALSLVFAAGCSGGGGEGYVTGVLEFEYRTARIVGSAVEMGDLDVLARTEPAGGDHRGRSTGLMRAVSG